MENLVDVLLLGFLAATAIAVVRLHDLFAIVMLTGIYSLLSAAIFVQLDAVDVAFTEASVGAGIATILMLGTLALTGARESKPMRNWVAPLAVVATTGIVLIYGTYDMPLYGDPDAPAHTHVAPYYIEETKADTGIPNIVTAVLASYRGYDTLGEVTVIFTAGVSVMLLLGIGRGRKEDRSSKSSPEKRQ